MPSSPSKSQGLDRALSPSIVRAAKVCQEKGLTKYRWRCSDHSELDPRFENHTLAQTSRPGRERWLEPENVKNTKAWFNKTGKYQQGRKWMEQYQEFTGHMSDSWNLHPSGHPVRDAWVHGSPMGAVLGNPSQMDPPLLGHQPKGYAKWVTVGERWTPNKKGVPRVVSAKEFNRKNDKLLLSMSKGEHLQFPEPKKKKELDTTKKKKTMVVQGGARSLPALALGSFPPTPAYVRHFMKQIDLEKPDVE